MNQEQEVQKRQEFKCILQDLARSQTELKDEIKLKEFINRLEQLYICPEHENPENYSVFRHYYSDIFIVLSEIANDKVEADSGESVSVDADIDILGQNLQIILMKYFRVTQLNRKNPEMCMTLYANYMIMQALILLESTILMVVITDFPKLKIFKKSEIQSAS